MELLELKTDEAIKKLLNFLRIFQVKIPVVDGTLERTLKKVAVEVKLSGKDTEDTGHILYVPYPLF